VNFTGRDILKSRQNK